MRLERKSSTWRWRLLAVLAGALCISILPANPASAHYVYEERDVWEGSGRCTEVRSEISHGDGGGYSKNDVVVWQAALTPWGMADCIAFDRMQAGLIAAAMNLYKWNTATGQWDLCAWTDWYYNPIKTAKYVLESYYDAPGMCGVGYYGNYSAGFHVFNNEWRGGWLWSGHHYLPAGDGLASLAENQSGPTGEPEGIRGSTPPRPGTGSTRDPAAAAGIVTITTTADAHGARTVASIVPLRPAAQAMDQ